MTNKKKIILIILILFIFFIIFKVTFTKTTKEQVEDYIKSIDFIKEEELYTKQLSNIDIDEYYNEVDQKKDTSYQILYFDTNNFQLIKTSIVYENSITYFFNPTYNYKTNDLTYQFEIEKNNTQVSVEGDYEVNSKKFNCEFVDYQKINLSTDDQTTICKKIEYDIEDFVEESIELFKDTNFLEKMQEK